MIKNSIEIDRNRVKENFTKITSKYSIIFILFVFFMICSIISPDFLSTSNITNIARQISVTTILAFGETILIICGMIDLSAGSILALSGVLSVSYYTFTGNLTMAIIIAILVAMACNAISGSVVSFFKVPPFIATLAMMTMGRGAALLYTNGQNIYQIGDYTVLGQGYIGSVPTPVIFMAGITFITWYVLKFTRFGRYFYAVGGNQEAARASGISIKRTQMTAYLFNGVLVGLAGVLFMSRVNAGLPNGGEGYEFEAMTGAIIGGASFSGGMGSALGTLAGAFIMGFASNIMNLLAVPPYLQQIVKGAIIIVAVIYDIKAKSKRSEEL